MSSRDEVDLDALIASAESMTPDEIHYHPMAALDKLRALSRELRQVAKAHTPTDDEREALRDELAGWVIGAGYYQSMVGTSDAAEMADAILAAGFRRTVQGETEG